VNIEKFKTQLMEFLQSVESGMDLSLASKVGYKLLCHGKEVAQKSDAFGLYEQFYLKYLDTVSADYGHAPGTWLRFLALLTEPFTGRSPLTQIEIQQAAAHFSKVLINLNHTHPTGRAE
jgi:hypothetical protein